jgi:hypothetical protein
VGAIDAGDHNPCRRAARVIDVLAMDARFQAAPTRQRRRAPRAIRAPGQATMTRLATRGLLQLTPTELSTLRKLSSPQKIQLFLNAIPANH